MESKGTRATRGRRWREANKAAISVYMAEYRKANADKIRAKTDEWRSKNAEDYKAKKRVSDNKAYHEKKLSPAYKEAVKQRRNRRLLFDPEKVRADDKARSKRYAEKNRDLVNEKARTIYHSKSVEKRENRKEYQRVYRESNVEKRRAYHKSYLENNPNLYKDRYSANRDQFIQNADKRRRALKGRGKYAKEEIACLYVSQHGKCAACRTGINSSRSKADKNGYEVDHVMPVSKGGSNMIENLQLLCRSCNRRKAAKTPDQWAAEIGKLFV